jgi:transposase
MDGRNEQRVARKFCFIAGISVTESLVLVQKAYGNEVLNKSNVYRWYSRFQEGRELVEDDKRGGHPK